MAKTEDKRIFIDTNILIYSALNKSTLNTEAIKKVKFFYENKFELWLNRQVLREYLSVMSRFMLEEKKYKPSNLINDINKFENQYHVANENDEVTQRLLQLISEFKIGGKQIHDANIVATMLANNVNQLLTHNIIDFKRYSKIINLIPLID